MTHPNPTKHALHRHSWNAQRMAVFERCAANTDPITGHITLVSNVPFGERTYTHMSDATGHALLRRLEVKGQGQGFLSAPTYGDMYAVRFCTQDHESSVTFLLPDRVFALPVPMPVPGPDWANMLTDTLIEHIPTGNRYYFSHAAPGATIEVFNGGRTSRTALMAPRASRVPARHFRVAKVD